PNAIALNSSMVNSARLLGPSIGGVLIASIGEGYCFLIDGISYIAVVIALLLMHVEPRPMNGPRASHLRELREGIGYAFGFAPIRTVLILTSMISIMGMSYTVLMPVFATQVLHGGSQTQGFLMAASGIGALIGALYLASRRTVLGLGRIIATASAVFGLGLVTFAFSRFLWLSLVMMFLSGVAMITQSASSNTILQTIVEDDKRGRVMSFFSVAFLGMAPIGSLLSGVLADYIGPSYTVAAMGSCCILAGIFFAMQLPAIRVLVRPIYVERGILPQMAVGIQSASQLHVPPEE
ncbi:MAG: MFS transporter, partial [Bacillota bacterium]